MEQPDPWLMYNLQIRYYLGIDPASLDDDQWAECIYGVHKIREEERSRQKENLKHLF